MDMQTSTNFIKNQFNFEIKLEMSLSINTCYTFSKGIRIGNK